MKEPDVSGFSDGGLRKLHDAVLHAFNEDEANLDQKEKKYGVREYSDWRTWSDALENELTKREIPHTKVPW